MYNQLPSVSFHFNANTLCFADSIKKITAKNAICVQSTSISLLFALHSCFLLASIFINPLEVFEGAKQAGGSIATENYAFSALFIVSDN